MHRGHSAGPQQISWTVQICPPHIPAVPVALVPPRPPFAPPVPPSAPPVPPPLLVPAPPPVPPRPCPPTPLLDPPLPPLTARRRFHRTVPIRRRPTRTQRLRRSHASRASSRPPFLVASPKQTFPQIRRAGSPATSPTDSNSGTSNGVYARRGARCRRALEIAGRAQRALVSFLRYRDKPARNRLGDRASPGKYRQRSRYGMHDAAPVRAIMRWSVGLLLLCWRLERVDRRPNPARMVAVDRTPAEPAEQPVAGDAGAAAAAPRDPRADRAEVAAPAAARPIRSGVRVASPAPVLVTLAAVPASRVLRRTAEPARLDRAARPAAAAQAVVAAQPAGRRARRHHRLGRCWRRVWLQWPRRQRRWIGRHGWIRAVRRARVHEQRALCATQLRRHRSALQSAPRWRPMSDGMDLSVFLQHFTDTGARLRGAAVHASRSFLHHASRVVRRHGHLLVPADGRLPDRRRMRPHQQRRSDLSVGLTKSEGTTMRELTTSNRSGFFARAEQLAAIVTLTIMIAGGCGSVNSAGGDAAAGASGQGGNAGNGASGAAGSGGTSAGRGGGGGFAGSTGGGAGGDGCGPGYPVGSSRPAGDGCNVCNCIAPGTWVCSTASCPIGGAGGGGTTGGGGGVAGAGGSGGTWRCWRQRRIRIRWQRRRRGGNGGSGGSGGIDWWWRRRWNDIAVPGGARARSLVHDGGRLLRWRAYEQLLRSGAVHRFSQLGEDAVPDARSAVRPDLSPLRLRGGTADGR